MKRLALALSCLGLLVANIAPAAEPDWKIVDQAFGVAGVPQPDGARRYNFPRRDLAVTVDGVQIKPGFALGSWLAFVPAGGKVMVMGDLVLTGDELNPVMKALVGGGIQVTAIHHHLLRASPVPWYMHVAAHGDAAQLAKAFRAGIAQSKTPVGPPAAPPQAVVSAVNIADLDAVLRAKGRDSNGVYQYSFPRAEALHDGGMAIGGSLGAATVINFQPTENGKAAITGDFVLIATEVNSAIDTLLKNGIEVTSLHNHMLNDQPRLFFLHFWAHNGAASLAKGLRATLDKTNLAGK